MSWRNWNKADKTLLTAGVLFMFSLCLNTQYPDNIFARGFMFCSEAALVGGIADWFAVTALFRKPLGFPWHTAILPRRRESFVRATGEMLQKEFFSKKKLLGKLKNMDFSQHIIAWLRQEDNQRMLIKRALRWLDGYKMRNGEAIEVAVQGKLQALPVADILASKEINLRDSEMAQVAIHSLLERGKEKAGSESVKAKILVALEDYQKEKLSGPMAMMMAGFAQSMNLINLPEAADLAKQQLIELIANIEEADTEEYKIFITILENSLKNISKNEKFKQELSIVWSNTINMCRNDHLIADIDLKSVDSDEYVLVVENIAKALNSWIDMVEHDDNLRQIINRMFYDGAARGVLQAQEMLGGIVRDVLAMMTDEQLNHLVYDKVEPDLLWIRMNGSIVGAGIGLVMYLLLQVVPIP